VGRAPSKRMPQADSSRYARVSYVKLVRRGCFGPGGGMGS
jgi:hypothetical protein